jgi:N-acetylglucosamine kinase-like BadF-type ATPase
MNAGYYDGHDLRTPMPSLGYVLGDECSGADIGRQLLRDRLYKRMPERIGQLLFPEGIELSEVVRSLYREPAPQAWLASFAARMAHHLDEPYVAAMIGSRAEALAELIGSFFTPVEYRETRALGSVAFGFKPLLEAALAKKGIRLSEVRRDPMEGLLTYHGVASR